MTIEELENRIINLEAENERRFKENKTMIEILKTIAECINGKAERKDCK
jgi:hypothetical protein